MDNRTRSRRVQVRLTDDEYDYFQYNVARTGLTQEAYLRTLILDTIPKTKEVTELDRNILSQLYAIGNNLNQIARMANSIHVINAERYDKTVVEFKDVMQKFLQQSQEG